MRTATGRFLETEGASADLLVHMWQTAGPAARERLLRAIQREAEQVLLSTYYTEHWHEHTRYELTPNSGWEGDEMECCAP